LLSGSGSSPLASLSLDADPHGTNTFAYDAEGQATNLVTSYSLPGFGPVSYALDYQYNAVGSVTSQVLRGLSGFTNQYESYAAAGGQAARVSTNNGAFAIPGVPVSEGTNTLVVGTTPPPQLQVSRYSASSCLPPDPPAAAHSRPGRPPVRGPGTLPARRPTRPVVRRRLPPSPAVRPGAGRSPNLPAWYGFEVKVWDDQSVWIPAVREAR
jgi:hypothetical protein